MPSTAAPNPKSKSKAPKPTFAAFDKTTAGKFKKANYLSVRRDQARAIEHAISVLDHLLDDETHTDACREKVSNLLDELKLVRNYTANLKIDFPEVYVDYKKAVAKYNVARNDYADSIYMHHPPHRQSMLKTRMIDMKRKVDVATMAYYNPSPLNTNQSSVPLENQLADSLARHLLPTPTEEEEEDDEVVEVPPPPRPSPEVIDLTQDDPSSDSGSEDNLPVPPTTTQPPSIKEDHRNAKKRRINPAIDVIEGDEELNWNTDDNDDDDDDDVSDADSELHVPIHYEE